MVFTVRRKLLGSSEVFLKRGHAFVICRCISQVSTYIVEEVMHFQLKLGD